MSIIALLRTARHSMAKTGRKGRVQFWAGFVHDEIDFYRESDYYEGVVHADLFKSKAAAKRCYEDVRPVRVRVERPKKVRRG